MMFLCLNLYRGIFVLYLFYFSSCSYYLSWMSGWIFFCKKVDEEVIGSSQLLLRSYFHQHGCKPQSTTYHTFQEALIAAGPHTCPSYIIVEIAGGCHCLDDSLFPMTLLSFFLPAPILPLIGSDHLLPYNYDPIYNPQHLTLTGQ